MSTEQERAHLRRVTDKISNDQREYAPDDPARRSNVQPGVTRIKGTLSSDPTNGHGRRG